MKFDKAHVTPTVSSVHLYFLQFLYRRYITVIYSFLSITLLAILRSTLPQQRLRRCCGPSCQSLKVTNTTAINTRWLQDRLQVIGDKEFPG